MGENNQNPPSPNNNNDIVPPSMLTGNAAVIGAILGNSNFSKNKVLADFTDEVKRRGHKLEAQPWYLGMLNSNDVEPYLKKVGDFAIHANDQQGGAVKLFMSVRGNVGVFHYEILFDALGRGWNLQPGGNKFNKFHKTVIDLVEYHKIMPLPAIPERILLVESLTRPSWFLKHEHILFNRADMLGKGNFCEVFKGKLYNRRFDIAVKVCHANWRYTDDAVSMATNVKEQQAREALVKEGAVMAKIRHPNVISFFGICCDHPPIMIAIELCPGDSLLKLLLNTNYKIEVPERVKYMQESATGMSFLQQNGLIHRDLAARNCLISKYGRVKIADFGLSKLVSQLAGEQWLNQQIPVRWMAPETLKAMPEYSIKSDVWAYGVLTYEIFNNGEKPFPEWENKKIATYIRRGHMPKMPAITPKMIIQIVDDCWKLQPNDRPDFMTIERQIFEIQTMVGGIAPPRPQETVVSKLDGVIALSQQELEVLEEIDDVQCEAANSAMTGPTPQQVELPPSIHGNVIDHRGQIKLKEVTIEDNSAGAIKDKLQPQQPQQQQQQQQQQMIEKKKKKKKKDATRDTHEEIIISNVKNKKKKKRTTTQEQTKEDEVKENRTFEDDAGFSNNTIENDADITQDKPITPPKAKTEYSCWIFPTILLLTTFAAEFQHDERERKIYRDYIDVLRNTSVGSAYDNSTSLDAYVYDPDVNPPWGNHFDLLKGEVVFIDQQYVQLALPKDITNITIQIDLKHCQKGAGIVKDNEDELYCLCYEADIKDQSRVAPRCYSREMYPICIRGNKVNLTESEFDLITEEGRSSAKIMFDLADKKSYVNGVHIESLPIPRTKRVYRFESDNKINVIEFKSPNCIHMTFENLIYTGELVQSRPFKKKRYPNKKSYVNGVHIESLPIPRTKRVYRFESDNKINVIEFKSPNCIHMTFENLIYTGELVQSAPFKKKRYPNVCRAGCACRSVPDINGDHIQIEEERDYSSAEFIKISSILMSIIYAIFI
uniref:Tyrosine-protein kinase n=2 Tax=Panagrolaimus sp. JU765 TaxID=591449 RepID=A0AC34QF39_9BILA